MTQDKKMWKVQGQITKLRLERQELILSLNKQIGNLEETEFRIQEIDHTIAYLKTQLHI